MLDLAVPDRTIDRRYRFEGQSMPRPTVRWLTLVVLFAFVGGTLALAQDQRPPGGRVPVADTVECPNCKTPIPFQAGSPPTKCPKCGEPITHIVNLDGTKTGTGATATEKNPYRWVLFGVGGGVLVLAAILAVIKAAIGGGKNKKKKKNAKPVEEEPEDGY
jgi:hypothetical protein